MKLDIRELSYLNNDTNVYYSVGVWLLWFFYVCLFGFFFSSLLWRNYILNNIRAWQNKKSLGAEAFTMLRPVFSVKVD